MGKHNGKARKAGLTVGSALVNRARRDGRTGSAAAYLHTTEPGPAPGKNMQSVIETNDLDEMMAMVRQLRALRVQLTAWLSLEACTMLRRAPGATPPSQSIEPGSHPSALLLSHPIPHNRRTSRARTLPLRRST